jgi:integrase
MKRFFKRGLDRYKKYLLENRYEKVTYQLYTTAIEEAINYIKIEDRFVDLTLYKNFLFSKKLAPKTILEKILAIKNFVKFLNKEYQLHLRVVGAEKIKVKKKKKELKYATIEEIKTALKVATPLERVLIILTFGTGAKAKEIASLKMDKIDIKNKTIEFNSGKKIELHPTIVKELENYIDETSPSYFLFETAEKEHIPQEQLYYHIHKSFKRVELEITYSMLKNSFAIYLLKNSGKVDIVGKLLGYEFADKLNKDKKIDTQKKFQTYVKAHPLCF